MEKSEEENGRIKGSQAKAAAANPRQSLLPCVHGTGERKRSEGDSHPNREAQETGENGSAPQASPFAGGHPGETGVLRSQEGTQKKQVACQLDA